MLERTQSYSAQSIPRGEPGILRTVDAVRMVIRSARILPIVRNLATDLTRNCGRGDDRCSALAILAWVRDHLRYVKDPIDTELVQTPDRLLSEIRRSGQAAGDCDDAAGLIGALNQSIGIPVRLAVGSFRTDRALHHVWAETVHRGVVIQQDPFRSERFASSPTRLVYRDV